MAMGTTRISPGRTVFRGRSALFKTGITGTGNIKSTRKNRIRSSGPIKNAMGAAAIRRVAATVDGVRAIFAMKARSEFDPRAEPQMAEAVEGNVLPAFITAPVRVPAEAHDAAPPVEALSPLLAGPPETNDAANGFHPRPSRRRGGKAETGAAGPHGGEAANANDPVQD